MLTKKRWQEDSHCQFYNYDIETTLHLFLKYPYIAKI